MNSFERKIAKNMEDHGWFTEIHEEKKSSQRIVDILAYKPRTGKMFYGNLCQLAQAANNKELLP